MREFVRRAWGDCSAQTTSEYGINTVLIAVGAVAAVLAIGAGVRELFTHISACLGSVNAGATSGC